MKTTPYQPSNSTDGELFQQQWCHRCARDAYDYESNTGKQCNILVRTMAYNIGDKQYPVEWIKDDDGPRCTAFVTEQELEKELYAKRMEKIEAAGQQKLF